MSRFLISAAVLISSFYESKYQNSTEAMAYIDNYKQKLQDDLGEAPATDEISTDMGNYTQPSYLGTINNIIYLES